MLTDTQTIRFYQKLTDNLVELWRRGHRYEDMKMYMEGFITCLRYSNSIEPYLVHRLEEEAYRFLRDPSNFEIAYPQVQPQVDYDYY